MRPIKPLKEDFAENWNLNIGWKQTLKKLFGSLAGVRWEIVFHIKLCFIFEMCFSYLKNKTESDAQNVLLRIVVLLYILS